MVVATFWLSGLPLDIYLRDWIWFATNKKLIHRMSKPSPAQLHMWSPQIRNLLLECLIHHLWFATWYSCWLNATDKKQQTENCHSKIYRPVAFFISTFFSSRRSEWKCHKREKNFLNIFRCLFLGILIKLTFIRERLFGGTSEGNFCTSKYFLCLF